MFDSVLVVSDRNVIDSQLQEAIFDFERTTGVVASIKGEGSSKSGELAAALSGDKKIVETAAKLVTFESWLKIGQEDAKVLDFYKKAGNEIIELDAEVQYAARKIGLDWADKMVKEGKHKWFGRVHKSLSDFDVQWKNAESWRKVKVRN